MVEFENPSMPAIVLIPAQDPEIGRMRTVLGFA